MDARDLNDATALFAASQYGRLELVISLLKAGADPTIKAKYIIDGKYQENTPVLIAIANKFFDIAKALIKAEPDCLALSNHAGGYPIHMAAQKGYTDLVKFMLSFHEHQVNYTMDGVTALHMAAEQGHVEVMKLLIDKGANYRNTGSVDEHGNLISALWFAAMNGHIEAVNYLLTLPDLFYTRRSILNTVYTKALLATINSRMRNDLITISDMIKAEVDSCDRRTPLPIDSRNYSEYFYSIELFTGLHPKSVELYNKDAAIRKSISAMYKHMQEPASCIPYVSFLSKELERQWHLENENQPLPTFDRNMVDMWQHDSMQWPIPNDKFQPIKKGKLLSRVILDKFKQYGMGDTQFKWTGYLPKKTATALLKENVFFNENRRIISGLFHGNMHNLQRVILLLAMEAGQIPLVYRDENGEQKTLEPKEVFFALTDPAYKNDGRLLWATVFDFAYHDTVVFSHPHRMQSVLMTDKAFSGFLQDYLLFAFCDHFNKLHELHNHAYEVSYSKDEFLFQIGKLSFHLFSGVNEFAIQMDEKKKLEDVVTINNIQKGFRLWSNQEKTYLPLQNAVKSYHSCK